MWLVHNLSFLWSPCISWKIFPIFCSLIKLALVYVYLFLECLAKLNMFSLANLVLWKEQGVNY